MPSNNHTSHTSLIYFLTRKLFQTIWMECMYGEYPKCKLKSLLIYWLLIIKKNNDFWFIKHIYKTQCTCVYQYRSVTSTYFSLSISRINKKTWFLGIKTVKTCILCILFVRKVCLLKFSVIQVIVIQEGLAQGWQPHRG